MTKLTTRQEEVLNWIKRFIALHQYPPTRSEIAKGMGFSSANAAEEHLQALARKQAISLTRGVSRGIAIQGGR